MNIKNIFKKFRIINYSISAVANQINLKILKKFEYEKKNRICLLSIKNMEFNLTNLIELWLTPVFKF